jgi:hypothetical protein
MAFPVEGAALWGEGPPGKIVNTITGKVLKILVSGFHGDSLLSEIPLTL